MTPDSRRTVFIETLGCQMNVYDSDLLRREFLCEGYRTVSDPAEADVILLNTCSIRKKAEARAWNRLTSYAQIRGNHGRPLIVLCGCVASRVIKGMGEGEAREVDIVAGSGSYRNLVSTVDRELGRPVARVTPVLLEDDPAAAYRLRGVEEPAPLKALVSISRGCDSHCAYCVVPSARGPHRSRPLSEILREVRSLTEHGTREVALLGQNVNVYRDGKAGFEDVLCAVAKIPDVWRIRFTSPHPKDMTPRVLEAMADLSKVCENLHLPLQSGSDNTLRGMNRGYTTDEFRRVVEAARSRIPGLAISTDLMVGFPGETEADFEDSMAFVAEMAFDAAFTFKYSQRPGTSASRFPAQVPEETKGRRLERLIALQNRITDERNRRLVGRWVEVLVEGRDRKNPDLLTGRTRTNRLVSFAGRLERIGSVVTVRVDSAGRWILKGSLSPERI